ncbi:PP2C family protein-serine/threonine phosphatase [Pedobacter glucosidilyticus]|uniref:PP2C family protein-serine/threonine phosphatase n=1 Tax=Pedobacter glucosidilyticus TaxID=1122941 RepID=UPI0026EA2F50|nr:PP2C family protein-serine/threonine phosphatase [Pedobacter glucosidilyticus]
MKKELNISKDEEQIDLIELLLKRQAELNALLEITQAINSNVPGSVLIEMLELILKTTLKVGRFRLLFKNEDDFICVSQFGGDLEYDEDYNAISKELIELKNPTELSDHPDPVFNKYEFFIPVYHKNQALAYILVGDFSPEEKLISNKIDYIQTLINVIIVAFENKKLFKERIQKERIQRDLELASQVQNMLIPQVLPKNTELDVEAIYRQHQTIGGDFYDFIELNDTEILWCVADVSGKGISAALIMANFQASLRALVSVDISLSELISRLNKVVYQNTKGDRFITLFLGKYNKQTRVLNFVNAGHNASLLIQNNSVEPLLKGTTMIGVFDELPFINEGHITIPSEALIFNYTDGILEFDGEEERSLSEIDLMDFLITHNHQDLKTIHHLLIKKIENTRRSVTATDDITILSLRFH